MKALTLLERVRAVSAAPRVAAQQCPRGRVKVLDPFRNFVRSMIQIGSNLWIKTTWPNCEDSRRLRCTRNHQIPGDIKFVALNPSSTISLVYKVELCNHRPYVQFPSPERSIGMQNERTKE